MSSAHARILHLVEEGALREGDGSRELRTREGASARVRTETSGDVLEVRDGRGRLVLEHDEANGRTVIHAPAGDLELAATRGSIRLAARDEVTIEGARGNLKMEDLRVESRVLTTVAERIKTTAGAIDTSAGRILERARNVYREVEELTQTRAGRIRAIASSSYQLLAKRARVKTEEDVTLDGRRIHLG